MIRGVVEHYGGETPRDSGKMVCPFHDDHNPSALINYETDWFTCFACDVTGSPTKLLMDREGLKYDEAKRLAAEYAGEEYGKVRSQPVRGFALPGKQGANRGNHRAF